MPRLRKKARKVSGAILIIAGMMLLLIAAAARTYSLRVLSFTTSTSESGVTSITSKIKRIDIDSVKITLEVTESRIVDGVWQISNSGASHLDISANPAESGNIVIYAHNKANLFGKLPKVRKGDIVKLTNEDGNTFGYAVYETITVTPDKIDYVMPKSSEVLTMYTCVGLLDSKRFIVLAKPI